MTLRETIEARHREVAGRATEAEEALLALVDLDLYEEDVTTVQQAIASIREMSMALGIVTGVIGRIADVSDEAEDEAAWMKITAALQFLATAPTYREA